MAPPWLDVDLDPVSVGLEDPDPLLEPALVVEADVSVLSSEDAVVDGEELEVVVVLTGLGFWAPQGLSTRHAVWQAESWEAHAATHWSPYVVHSKYGMVWE